MADGAWRDFVAVAGWGGAQATPLAGDASARRYIRLRREDGARAVLMVAPPAPDDSTARFVAVAEALATRGIRTPAIMAARPAEGLALLEDLGDAVFARVIDADPRMEPVLYDAAVDLLSALHRQPAPIGLPTLDAATLATMTAPAADWYAGGGMPQPALARSLSGALLPLLSSLSDRPPVLAHRDYHAENLIWLPDATGLHRVGVLDFQDAFAGPAAYDLVSLLEDARRDLAPGLRERLEARFAAATDTDPDALDRALAILGAQRNLRILGVFVRLARAHGKPRYLSLLPRVWRHLMRDLAHPDLDALRRIVTDSLPPPDTAPQMDVTADAR
jgi:aminoglycoside/choline kinase family phosphotransferase